MKLKEIQDGVLTGLVVLLAWYAVAVAIQFSELERRITEIEQLTGMDWLKAQEFEEPGPPTGWIEDGIKFTVVDNWFTNAAGGTNGPEWIVWEGTMEAR